MSSEAKRYSVLARKDEGGTIWKPLVIEDAEGLYNLHEDYAALEAKLAALEWTPITPENLPPLGEQVEAYTNEGEILKVHRELEELADDDMREPQSYYWSDHADQEIYGVTHFRPINAPAAHPGGQKVQK